MVRFLNLLHHIIPHINARQILLPRMQRLSRTAGDISPRTLLVDLKVCVNSLFWICKLVRGAIVVCFSFFDGAVDGGEANGVGRSADGMAASGGAEESLGEDFGEDWS